MSNIDDVIKAAQLQAEANKSTGTDVATTTSNAPATRGAPLGLDDLMTGGGLTVDRWLKINEFGIFVADSKVPLQTITAAIDLSQVKYKFSIRYGQNPVKYDHTYDHRVSTQGMSWSDAIERAKKVTPDAREYRSADIPLVIPEALTYGKETVDAFSVLGLTLNVTGWRKWETFVGSLARQGIDPQQDVVLIELGFQEMNKNGNTWGLPTFTLKEKLDELPS